MKKCSIKILSVVALVCLVNFSLSGQADPGEVCETHVFTGTQTFPPGGNDPVFDWECQGEWGGCTEVYIICGPE